MRLALINPLKFQHNLIKQNEIVSLTYLQQFLFNHGHIADIINLEMENNSPHLSELKKLVKYDMIGISCYFPFNPLDLANAIKSIDCKIYIFAGGPMASLGYKELLYKNSPIDAVIINEGEWSLLELVENYIKKRSLSSILGVATFIDGKIKFERRMFENQLDKFPFPHRVQGYYEKFIPTIITSRGCNGKCTFCSTRYTGHWRGRSPANVYAEIQHIVIEHGQTHFQFVEPNFLQDGQRAYTIATLIMNLPCKVTFDFACRINSIIKHQYAIKQLKNAGAIKVLLGVENFSNVILDQWKKEITCEEIQKAIKILNNNELAYSISLILFHPDVSITELKLNIKYIEKLSIINYIENLYNALLLIPGTKMNLTTKNKEWHFKDKRIENIYKACLDYRTDLEKWANPFYIEDYEILFTVNAFFKNFELNKLKQLLHMPITQIKLNKSDVFLPNTEVYFEKDKKNIKCVNRELGMIIQLDDNSLKVYKYVINKKVFKIIKDLKNLAPIYQEEKNIIINIMILLLKNRILLIGIKK